jgi:glyoxalase family protein
MALDLKGMHHVSALSAHIGRTRHFYTRVLGLRPVITTVNQDDPTMYHLFFSDGRGSPGSEMTVFDMPHAAPEYRGTNSISRTTFRVAGARALEYWRHRFDELSVEHQGVGERDGRTVLDFEDVVGTQLSLVDDAGAGDASPWSRSPVPEACQIRGLGYNVLTVPQLAPTDRFLREALGFEPRREYAADGDGRRRVHVYTLGNGGVHQEIHIAVRDDLPRAKYGSGGVHHLALRVADGGAMPAWVDRLTSLGHHNSGIVDRHYFKSIYVREPNHILFELATDGPGFDVDGPVDAARLSLPPALEPRRGEIEAALRPIGESQ